MSHPRRKYLVILVAMVVIPLAGASALINAGAVTNEFSGNGYPDDPVDTESFSRSSTTIGDNYRIESDSPVMMPEENGSWVQDQWSGGGGQDIWSDPGKFRMAENLIASDPEGDLELEMGAMFEGWKQLNDGPGARYRHSMVYAPEKKVFYVFGGLDDTYNGINDLYKYDPAANSWREIGKTNRPEGRANAALVWDSANGLLWVYGGSRNYQSDYLNDLWKYDPDADKWTRKADGIGARCFSPGVFDPGSKQLIFYGGYDGDFYTAMDDVFTYSPDTNTWSEHKPFSPRYYHNAVWVTSTSSMFVYGGVEGYETGVGYKEVTVMSEYFPQTDTWVNHTGIGKWRNPIMAWDSSREQIILHSGLRTSYTNETWFFDVEHGSWEQSLNGPPIRYDGNGDWDSELNQFVIFGGRYSENLNDLWIYSAEIPGYKSSGELFSSVFDAGFKVNPRKVSYNLSKSIPAGTGSECVKIQIAASTDSPAGASDYIGPDGTATSHFNLEAGQTVPDDLKGSRYIGYFINLTTDNMLYTPTINWVKLDYYTYPSQWTIKSVVYDLGQDKGAPLRLVEWSSSLPDSTNMDIFVRHGDDEVSIVGNQWEKVESGQDTFGYNSGRYFQYRLDLRSDDPGSTPVLEQISFTFDLPPDLPVDTVPVEDGWIGGSQPVLRWKFIDPDEGDFQTAIEVLVASDEDFWYRVYTSDTIVLMAQNYSIPVELDNGQYYWRMRVRDNYDSWSEWTTTSSFNVDATNPPAPRIDCYTHPIESLWYSDNQGRFDWNEPEDITGIAGFSYLLDQDEQGEPPEEIMMSVDEFTMKHNVQDFNGFLLQNDLLADGVWYFHLKAVDNMGHWSESATRAVRVDTGAPLLTDETVVEISSGDDLKFELTVNDEGSGIDHVVLYYRYSGEPDFLTEDLVKTGDNTYTYVLKAEPAKDQNIDYYLIANDLSSPVNEIRVPSTNHKQVTIVDNIPPVITTCTGSIDQSYYKDLTISIETADNVGISTALIFLNGETGGQNLIRRSDGSYNIVIDRDRLWDMTAGGNDNEIIYHIVVWDHSQNSARIPESGDFNITLKDLEQQIDDPKPKSGSGEQESIFEMLLANIIALAVILVVVGLVLFMFIKKQSENIYSDRHKLRMAIADVSEGATIGSQGAEPPMGIQTVAEPAGLPPGGTTISYDPTGMIGQLALPSMQNAPVPQAHPVTYLPPAPQERGTPTPTALIPDMVQINYTTPVNTPVNTYKAGPMEVTEKNNSMDEPSSIEDLRVFDSNNNPGRKPSLRIDLKPGLSVSLPKDK